MKSLVTGATGLVGSHLVRVLGAENVVVLSRDAKKAEAALGAKAFAWDGRGPVNAEALADVTTVFHLAGESVNGRWTAEKKDRILASRRDGTRGIVGSIAGRPITLVAASAVGFYGSRGDEVLDEDSGPGTGFLADVCRTWEAEAAAHTGRVVSVRIGLALAREGGALGTMLPLFRAGLAGKLGDGRQWMPWIHIDDLVRLFVHAAKDDALRGPLNGSAPEPVTNAAFTKALGKVLHRPTVLAAPAFALKLVLGEMGEVVLGSQRAVPKKALASGFTFAHRDLEEALADVQRPT